LEHLADWAENVEFGVRFGTASQAFSEFSGKGELEEVTGETPSLTPFLEHVYPGMIPLHVPAVNGLLKAEQFGALASVLSGYEYPAEVLRDAWVRQLEAMDCHYEGSEAGRIFRQRIAEQEEVIRRTEQLKRDAQVAIAERVTIGEGPLGTLPVVVFNSLGWQRSGVVDVTVSFLGEEEPTDYSRYEMYKIVNARGETVPSQEISGRQTTSAQMQLRFTATEVPSHGYNTYYLIPSVPEANQLMGIQEPGMMTPEFPEPSFVIEDVEERVSEPYRGIRVARRFRTRFYDLDVDETTGEVGILDRRLSRTIARGIALVGREENLESGLNQYAYTGRKYELAVDRVDLEESGEVEAVLLVAGRLASSPVEIRYRMYGEIDRIDVELSLWWRDEKPVRIQMVFPFGEGEVKYGVPFGHNTLDNVIGGSGPWREGDMDRVTWQKQRECQGWIAVDGKGGGVVLASDRRAFEFDDAEVRSDVLRSCPDPASFSYHRVWRRYPDQVKCRYSIRGYEGDFARGKAFQDGMSLNQSLDTRCVYDTQSPKSLPQRMSFVDLQGEGLVTTALKPAEDGDGFVLRAYEATGNPTQATLVTNGKHTQLMEVDPLERGSVELNPDAISFTPFEIKTMRFGLEPSE
jgi:alpha-mannosidase